MHFAEDYTHGCSLFENCYLLENAQFSSHNYMSRFSHFRYLILSISSFDKAENNLYILSNSRPKLLSV